MRISDLSIENFRAIERLELADLGDMIVVAGPNGCGKTQIYHAIRLLKSTYGGYQPNEYQQWWGEFQINLNKPGREIYRVFRDPTKALRIRAGFALTDSERAFLREEAEAQIRARIWQELVPGLTSATVTRRAAFAQAQRQHGPEVERLTKIELAKVLKALEAPVLSGAIAVEPTLEYVTEDNVGLELLFSTYEPERLGVIDYHGAHRRYDRQQIGGINLSIEQSEDRTRKHALYGWQNKFSNIKSELAAGYIRELIAAEAGVVGEGVASLTATLQELFSDFFPGKHFPGPVPGPDGTLDFPVQLAAGGEHDIDDLSSGEKEVLFGYLRLRNTAPRNSVVLIDEPELHLNPGLLRGLPQFYHKHIGRALDNQLWLVTHSDALLREAVKQDDFSVFHMQQGSSVGENDNQLQPISVGERLDRAVVDLLGDLATYQPGGKVVIFEGGGGDNFDVRMTTALFPQLNTEVNTIAAGDRGRVRELHELLRQAADAGTVGGRFFSIVDRDSLPLERVVDLHSWDRYHIENYLLEPGPILKVLQDLNVDTPGLRSAGGVKNRLASCAEKTLPSLVRHELESSAYLELSSAVRTDTPRGRDDIATALHEAVVASHERVEAAMQDELSLSKLTRAESRSRRKFAGHLTTDRWLETFRGRDILKRFVADHVRRVDYEVFRDLVLAKMQRMERQPPGMKKVVSAVLEA